jgi:hypothetical protein
MRFENPTKWEIFLDGFHNFWNCLDCYNDGDTWGYDEFWEGLNLGWYMEYIILMMMTLIQLPHTFVKQKDFMETNDMFHHIQLYVSEEAYDKLVEAINAPPEPKVVERLKQIMSKPAPWDEENDTRR